jgi:hypothetical protein
MLFWGRVMEFVICPYHILHFRTLLIWFFRPGSDFLSGLRMSGEVGTITTFSTSAHVYLEGIQE